MKRLLILLLSISLTSCGDYTETRYCEKGTIRVLAKEKYPCVRGGGYCVWNMYLYNGEEAQWYSTNQVTYNSYNVNDTLPTIILTIIKTEKTEK